MKDLMSKVGAWFKKTYQVVKKIEDAMDYRVEDYALDRIKVLEQRISTLEGTTRT